MAFLLAVLRIIGETLAAQRKRTGESGPPVIPHPKHLVIDPMAGTVTICGPLTIEEQAIYDDLATQWTNQLEECRRISLKRHGAPDDVGLEADLDRAFDRWGEINNAFLERGWERPETKLGGDGPGEGRGRSRTSKRQKNAATKHQRKTARPKRRRRPKKPPQPK